MVISFWIDVTFKVFFYNMSVCIQHWSDHYLVNFNKICNKQPYQLGQYRCKRIIFETFENQPSFRQEIPKYRVLKNSFNDADYTWDNIDSTVPL